MNMTVSKEFRFEAAHSLPHLPDGHKCRRLHGHSYRIVVFARGPINRDMGWFIDYADISSNVKAHVVDVLDHRNLNDFISPSTAENLAAWCWQQLDGRLPGLCRIDVHETDNTCVTYEGNR